MNKHGVRLLLARVALSCVSILVTLFVLDGIIGRFLFVGTSYRQSPNAEYHYSDNSFSFQVKLNSDGFRERELPTSRFAGGKRIVFLGDSMVFGWGVDVDKSFVRLVERKLKSADDADAWDIINLGVEGTGPPDYRDNLLTFGPQLHPDLVIVCYYTGNDAISEVRPRRAGLRRPRFHENLLHLYPRNLVTFFKNRLVLLSTRPDHAMPGTLTPNPLSHYLESKDLAVRARVAAIDPATLDMALNWQINPYLVAGSVRYPNILARHIEMNNTTIENPSGRMMLREMRDLARQSGAELKLVSIPPGYTVDRTMWPALRKMGYRMSEALLHERRLSESLAHFATQLDVDYLDLFPILKEAEEQPYCSWDPHLTPYGNELVARAVADWILGEQVLRHESQEGPKLSGFTSVQRWDFGESEGSGGWDITGKSGESEIVDGVLHVTYTTPVAMLVNTDFVLDATHVNRMRVRIETSRGHTARLFWGRPPTDTSGTYPFSVKRVAVFPIKSDEAMHTYDIALDHAVADWGGKWTAIRFDPALLHKMEGDMTGETVGVDFIEFGYGEPVAEPPNVWAACSDAP